MTLVLAWETIEGIAVVADTRFGSKYETATEAGPKIFAVPIVLNQLGHSIDTVKCRLPCMGFAFAGNVSVGQTINALATTCLQNLLAPSSFDDGPTVAEVTALYARCAILVATDRRKWRLTDIHLDAFIFGRSSYASKAQAFWISFYVDAESNVRCETTEVELSEGGIVAIGSGSAKVREIYEGLNSPPIDQRPMFFSPLDALSQVISDPDVPSVAGHQQFAVATRSGVELRPGLRDLALQALNPFAALENARTAEGIKDYQVLGFDMAEIGPVGPYHPTATHFICP